jgi:hypothetical protein
MIGEILFLFSFKKVRKKQKKVSFELVIDIYFIIVPITVAKEGDEIITSLMYIIFERRKVYLRAKDGCLG